MKQVTHSIKNIEYETSTQSSRSHRRSVGQGSRSSCESTNSVLKAAALKTKLKYIHAEAQQKAELEKIRTLKELDIAQSKISALEELEGATADSMSCNLEYIPMIDMVEMYLKNQQDEQVKTEPVDTNVYLHVPTVQPSMKYRPELLSRTSVPKILPATSVRSNA